MKVSGIKINGKQYKFKSRSEEHRRKCKIKNRLNHLMTYLTTILLNLILKDSVVPQTVIYTRDKYCRKKKKRRKKNLPLLLQLFWTMTLKEVTMGMC